MKDASVQDNLAADKGVPCFEMEAAGAPCKNNVNIENSSPGGKPQNTQISAPILLFVAPSSCNDKARHIGHTGTSRVNIDQWG
jgi:hypothetical protein